MNRRDALHLSGLALSGLLAGCSKLQSDEPSKVRVSWIEIRNRLAEEVDVSVLLLDAGEVAYWRTISVPTAPSPFEAFDDLPGAPGEYTLYAQVPTSEGDPPVHIDLVEDASDLSCVSIHMEVTTAQKDGQDIPSVAYGFIGECRNDK